MTPEENQRLADLLAVDPLDLAQKITGGDYKEDESVMLLGVGLGMVHNKRKAEALQATGDTHWGISFIDFLDIARREGFEPLISDVFTRTSRGSEGQSDVYTIWWHPEGILLTADSYREGVNGATIHYNVRFRPDVDWWSRTSSGSMHRESYDLGERIWVGDSDVREGFALVLGRFREVGEFLSPWVQRPFLLLGDKESRPEYDAAEYFAYRDRSRKHNEAVIARLPEHVQEAIGADTDP